MPDRTLDPYLAEFIPVKKAAEVRSHVHPGFEFMYVLSGEMDIRHGSQNYILSPGDSVYFDASTPHSYRCVGTEHARVIIVTQHQAVMAQPSMNLRPLGSSLSGVYRSGAAAPQEKREPVKQEPENNHRKAITRGKHSRNAEMETPI